MWLVVLSVVGSVASVASLGISVALWFKVSSLEDQILQRSIGQLIEDRFSRLLKKLKVATTVSARHKQDIDQLLLHISRYRVSAWPTRHKRIKRVVAELREHVRATGTSPEQLHDELEMLREENRRLER